MAFSLVLTSDTPDYPKGTILTDPTQIDEVRTGEYALHAVQVSDTVIPPPAPPPPPPDLSIIQQLVQGVLVDNQEQDAALSAAAQINAQQAAAIAGQSQTIQQQTQTIDGLNTVIGSQNNVLAQQAAALNALSARVNALENDAPPPPAPETADDVPLAEDSGEYLSTDSGKILYVDPD
jgi:uncharacterized coiled-coil protein SlyX